MKLNDSLLYQIHALSCRVEAVLDDLCVADGKVGYAEYKVLVAVEEGGQTTYGTIAKWLGLSAPTLSYLGQRLVGKGYLRLQTVEGDRRTRRVCLTTSGKQLHQRLTVLIEQQVEIKFAAALNPHQAKQLGTLMRAVESEFSS